jgi:hypothetical protein
MQEVIASCRTVSITFRKRLSWSSRRRLSRKELQDIARKSNAGGGGSDVYCPKPGRAK